MLQILSFFLLAPLGGLALLSGHPPKDLPCYPRLFGDGSTVCVCNASYCDTIHPLRPFPSRMFNMYISSQNGSRFAFSRRNFVGRLSPKAIRVTVNSSEIFQTVTGFGGSMTDAAVNNVNTLSEGTQERLFEAYFSPKGLEYGLLKLPVGGTDYSDRPHTLDEEPGDTALHHFALSKEDLNLKVPHLLKIRKMSSKGVQILATAWTAPPWMKTNGDYNGIGVLKEEFFDLWAKYLIRFLEEYRKRGVAIWAVGTGHQPSAGFVPFYPFNCMGWTPLSQARWVADHLGPQLADSMFNQTKIVALDDLRFFLPWWPKLMFSNHKAKYYVSGIGVQWYWDFILPSRLLDLTHADFPNKFILGTEASFNKWRGSSTPVVLGSWARAEEYAESIINDMNHWVSGWMDSNLVLDLDGGPSWVENFADAAVIVNASADEFYKQPMFYAMGHFSKFVDKGSVRVSVKVSKSAIKATGFRTPQGLVVVVLLNKKTHDVPVSIVGAKKGNANIWLPKKSIMTVIYRDKKKFPLFNVFF